MKNEDVLKLAVGKWPSILTSAGADGRAVSGLHSPCPICGGKDRFRMIQLDGQGRWVCNQCGSGDGMDLLMAIQKMNFKQAADWLRPIVGGCMYVPPTPIKNRKSIMKKNVSLWNEATPMSQLTVNNALEKYLEARGLNRDEYLDADLRLHPTLALYDEDGKSIGSHPAMLARVANRDGKLALIHRTYLVGEAETIKKMTSSSREWKGGCARLFSTADQTRLIVSEGIETGLSVRARLFRKHGLLLPVWAALNANALIDIAVPEHITNVLVAGDNDSSYTGQKAAFALANRLVVHDNRVVQVVIPKEKDTDWNDVLLTGEE